MILDLQKASMWKRISASLFDFIIVTILIVGFAALLSWIVDYDAYNRKVQTAYDEYGEAYGVDLHADENTLTEQEKTNYYAALEALNQDTQALQDYTMLFYLTLIVTNISILLGFIIMEFVLPIIFKNGQTLGKKIFGICVMRVDGVKITNIQLFMRSILGKCTVETLIPVLLLIMIMFGMLGLTGTVVLILFALLQIILVATTNARTPIHDLLAGTVTVDKASQLIFDSTDELIEFKKRMAAEQAERAQYK
ncbi:MAG: RDD family protein [Clostridia bacterium]|nr:RDD family protein [Clostridia bacterium]